MIRRMQILVGFLVFVGAFGLLVYVSATPETAPGLFFVGFAAAAIALIVYWFS